MFYFITIQFIYTGLWIITYRSIDLQVELKFTLDYWIVINKWTSGTEQVKWTNEQEKEARCDKYTKDELVKTFCWRTQCFDRVVSITSISNVQFKVVVEQLPELEHIKSCLTESKVQ